MWAQSKWEAGLVKGRPSQALHAQRFSLGQLVSACVWARSVTRSCLTLCDPVDGSPPGSSVHVLLQERHWGTLPLPPLGDLLDPGIQPRSPALQADSSPLSRRGSTGLILASC